MQRKDVVRGAIIGCLVSLCVVMANADERKTSSAAAAKAADAITGSGQKPAKSSLEKPSRPVIRGTVVDNRGAPVANVEVLPLPVDTSREDLKVRTDAAGEFALTLPFPRSHYDLAVLDRVESRLNFYTLSGRISMIPLRIPLNRGRSIAVTVVDAKNRPIAGAKVGVAFNSGFDYLRGRIPVRRSHPAEQVPQPLTDAAGKSVLLVPKRSFLACVLP